MRNSLQMASFVTSRSRRATDHVDTSTPMSVPRILLDTDDDDGGPSSSGILGSGSCTMINEILIN